MDDEWSLGEFAESLPRFYLDHSLIEFGDEPENSQAPEYVIHLRCDESGVPIFVGPEFEPEPPSPN